jgi:signal transduction histidine kinase
LNDAIDSAGGPGIRFYGTMVASISHEVKNVLAIINENIGLLEDYNSLAARGVPIDPAKLEQLLLRIKNQVQRGDLIIQNLNRFAHSGDEPVRKIALGDLVGLVCVLSTRFATLRGITLTFEKGAAPTVRTAPFHLENLIWLCLKSAIEASAPKEAIEIHIEAAAAGACIRISCAPQSAARAADAGFPSGTERVLADLLKAGLFLDAAAGQWRLTIPEDING